MDLERKHLIATANVDMDVNSRNPERFSGACPATNERAQLSIHLCVAVALIAFTFVVFGNVINQYFSLDYFDVLCSAKYNTLWQVLLGQDTSVEGGFFRPIGMSVFWVQMKLFGPNPAIYNINVLILHALTAILAANLFHLLFRNPRCAAIAGFVFVVFPNHAETIHWPAIFDLWAAVFYLAALNLFGYYRLHSRISFLIWALIASLAAFLSKELAFTLPISIAVFDFFFTRLRSIDVSARRRMVEISAYFGLLLIVLALTRVFLNIGFGYTTVEGKDFISLYVSNIGTLVADLVQTYRRSWMYLFAPISPKIPYARLLISLNLLAVALACGWMAWVRRASRPALAYCFLFAAIALLPVLATASVFAISHWVRFLYLPSVGACYVIAMILDEIAERIKMPQFRYGFLVAALVPMIFLTKRYDNEWISIRKDNEYIIKSIVEELRELPAYSRVYVSGIPWSKDGIPAIGPGFPTAIALYHDREYLEAALAFLPGDRELALEREPYSEKSWHYYWADWNSETRSLEGSESIQPAAFRPAVFHTWDFSTTRDRRYLQCLNQAAQLLAPGIHYPLFVVQGEWVVLSLPWVDPSVPIKYVTLNMMVKGAKRKRDVARLFWITEEDQSISGEKSIAFFVTTDGEFHEYKIPLYRSGLSLKDPRILRLFIRPNQNSGAVFSVREMSVESY